MNIYGRSYPHDANHVRVKITKSVYLSGNYFYGGLYKRGLSYRVPISVASELIHKHQAAHQVIGQGRVI